MHFFHWSEFLKLFEILNMFLILQNLIINKDKEGLWKNTALVAFWHKYFTHPHRYFW